MTSTASRFQIRFAWRPIKQVRRVSSDIGGFDFTGAVYWLRKVNAVNNLHHGWIAFDDQQTEEHFARCPSCHQLLKDTK